MNHPKASEIKPWHFILWINQHLHLPVFHQSVHHLKTAFTSLTEKCMCETNCVCLCLIWNFIFFSRLQPAYILAHTVTPSKTCESANSYSQIFLSRLQPAYILAHTVTPSKTCESANSYSTYPKSLPAVLWLCWATKIKLYYVMRFFIELIFSLQIFPSSPPDVVFPVCPVCSILGVKG